MEKEAYVLCRIERSDAHRAEGNRIVRIHLGQFAITNVPTELTISIKLRHA